MLTVRQVETLKKPGLIADGAGLYLQITASGAKTWILRYQIAGKRRDMGLGSTSVVTLAEAREKAREQRRRAKDGIDPIDQRRAERAASAINAAKAMTFRQCAEAYIKSHKADWRNASHAAQWPGSLEAYVYPVFGDLPVQAIDVGLVMRAVEPIWTTKAETASRVRGRIESILDWATVSEYRCGDNPARWRGHLEHKLSAPSKAKRAVRQAGGQTEHLRALPYAEMAAFMADLRKQTSIAARALEFAILTAARSGEVLGARWDEIDVDNKLWTIPGDRMKAGKEHRVPLSDATTAIVEKMAELRMSEFVFPGAAQGRPLGHRAMFRLLTGMRDNASVHGFRSTFSDWCTEKTLFPAEVLIVPR